MILTDAERSKFALYLEETAHDNELLAKQMDSIVPALAVKYRSEALAAKVVARVLRETRGESIDAEGGSKPCLE